MLKSRLILLLCVLTAFGAGLCAGALWRHPGKAGGDHWLAELNLTPQQHEQIKAIWSETMHAAGWQAQREKRDAARAKFEEDIKKLITPEQQKGFEELQNTYRQKLDGIAQEAKAAKDQAYERTKALLTEEQRVKYDELRKKRDESHAKAAEKTDTATGAATK